ncbi:hypothetical protein ES707_02528 [subsurface metagenome]
MKAELGEVRSKAGLGAGDAEVGGNGKAQPTANRGAMHGGDDRLLVAEDAHGLHIEMVDRQVRRRVLLRLLFLLLALRIGEIGAGAERLALSGQHGGADLDVPIKFLQRIRDLVDQGDVEEIQRGLTDFDQADVAVLLDADIGVLAHIFSF